MQDGHAVRTDVPSPICDPLNLFRRKGDVGIEFPVNPHSASDSYYDDTCTISFWLLNVCPLEAMTE